MLNEIALSNSMIARERVTFEIKIPKWVKTTGNFVEFLIHIRYLEGDRKQWEIYRRFSDF
jgi:hypothetical protein